KESLEIKRKALENFIEKGLYPYSKHYLDGVKKMRDNYFGNHFSTIGLLGMNEACLNFLGENIATKRGRKFALEILDFMREKMVRYQEETGNLYNLEATPAEGTSFRQAKTDEEKYPEIITAGTKKVPYYTNSSQLPVNYTDDIFEALKLQDDLQCRYTGGCIEKGNNVLTDKGLLPIEQIVDSFSQLKPIRALSYNPEKRIGEWDEILEAVKIDVQKHNKIRIKGERGLDIVTSDWHPFFVLERFKPNPACPICKEEMPNLKVFASHIRWNPVCREDYKVFPKYKVLEKRADELRIGDYVLQNSDNLYIGGLSELNNDLIWLIGFFIGDGCISKFIDNRGENHLERYKVRFFSEHQEALDKIARILNQYFKCNVRVIHNSKRSELLKEVTTSKKEVLDFFFRYKFSAGQKVYNISIPQTVKDNLTKTNVFSLLSGLMDSDGHIDKRQGDFEYYTVSSRLADDILEICSVAGIMISKIKKTTKRKNEKDIWRLRIPEYEIIKIKERLTNTVHLSRIGKSLSNRKKRHLPVVRVKEISKVDVDDDYFYDLMTEKNHNYLAGKNCLVFIHNTVLHLFLGEQVSDIKSAKALVKRVFEKYRLPYITLTPTFSICPSHGYLAGEHFECPQCTIKQPCEVYSRVVGYLRPVNQYHIGKQQEFRDRKTFKMPKL
ncbi:MAG: anaerobic ribonucleoside-triphosphate reductase, partial [bacterium]|nr:anaerobic ribonucleoside-triphosphate reductase [bacterium]